MLQHLSVSNYALINKLSIDFDKGLTTITGETGAGKSILLGALGLIIGQRADSQSLRDKGSKCIVEGTFEIKEYNLNDFFRNNDLDYSDTTIIRREINPAGTSRAFINDTPVTLALLRELGLQLIDIHSQHETLAVNESAYQLGVIDSFAKNKDVFRQYQKVYASYKETRQRLSALELQEKQAQLDADYFQFIFNELDEAKLLPGELETAEQELETLTHSEEIKLNLSRAATAFSDGEVNLLSQLNDVKNTLNSIARYNPLAQQLSERLQSIYVEAKDISNEIEQAAENIQHDPARIEYLNERLNIINNLLQKHRSKNIEELFTLKEEISQKLEGISSLSEEILKAQTELKMLEAELSNLSEQLTKSRLKIKDKFEKEVAVILKQLNMPDANLQVDITPLNEYNESGKDKIRFLFTANKGGDFKELGKVASGGELSRLMLAIKSIISTVTSLPTIIFDEIDTGVSGEVAGKIGNIMVQMAQSMQVVTITHLPQIASKGSTHLFVFKTTGDKATTSSIRALNKNERVEEIARMLSGEQMSQAAIENAKELLKSS